MIYPANLNTKFDFGKHKGKTVEEVCDDDPSYVEWCIDNVDDFELDNEAYDYYEDELAAYYDERHRGDIGDY